MANILGTPGNDLLPTVEDNAGNDLIKGKGGNDTLDGGTGNDRLLGAGGDDVLSGGDGNDLVKGGGGNDDHSGGAGEDTLIAGGGADILNGDGDNDRLNGGGGDDTLHGGNGDDDLTGKAGDDVLYGGDGDDVLEGHKGQDTLDGGDGNDTYRVFKNDVDADTYLDSGTSGTDTLDATNVDTLLLSALFSAASTGLEVIEGDGTRIVAADEAVTWDFSGMSLTGITQIRGTTTDDSITGSPGDDKLMGLAGDDSVSGGSGDDTLIGAAGNDTIVGGDGNDVVKGSGGSDILGGEAGADRLLGGGGDDTLNGGIGIDILKAGGGTDTLIFDNNDSRVDGGGGVDTLVILNDESLDLTAEGASSTFKRIEIIDMTGTGNNTLSLDESSVRALSGDTLMVMGNFGDIIDLSRSGFIDSGMFTTSGNTTFAIYSNPIVENSAVVLIDQDVRAIGIPVELSAIEQSVNVDGFLINGVSADDYSGASISSAGDVNGDGLADVVVGAFKADPNGESSGASYVVFGKTGGTKVELSDVEAGIGGFVINGASSINTNGVSISDFSGRSVSGAGDVNGDGLDDVIVGAFGDDPNGNNSGASFVVFGKTDGTVVELSAIQESNNGDGYVINGVSTYDSSGGSVSGAGDVNGDGLTDVIVGAQRDDPNGANSGASYVVFGKTDGTVVELSDIEQSGNASGFVINGVSAGDQSGISVSGAGDVNGDGLADVIVGVFADDPNGTYSGASFVVFGKTDGTVVELIDIEQSDNAGGFAINGVLQGDQSGLSVSAAGDVNGDGLVDLIVGTGEEFFSLPHSKASYVVFGKPDGVMVELSNVAAGIGGFVIKGVSVTGFDGHWVSGAGDVNGDGLADLIVGAPRDEASYVVFGKTDVTEIELSDLEDGTGGLVLNGSGYSISSAGDVNGDGFDDVIVGDPEDFTKVSFSGASFVVFGGNFTESVDLLGTENDDELSGTGASEILIGARGADTLNGGDGDDLLKGAAGEDIINGGDGNDTLEGDSGDDVFLFDSTLSASNVDEIKDFEQPGTDSGDLLHLDKTIFTTLGTTGAALTVNEYLATSGTPTGTDGSASTRIVYDTVSGGLYYDANGNTAGGLQQFASLAPKLGLTADDFFVVS